VFLTPEEIAELTGIARGRSGVTREQLQAAQLRDMGIAFRINARGRPVVTWDAVNGIASKPEPTRTWRSNILNFG
jgi:hypothetical protein